MKIIDILVAKANGTLEDGFEFAYDDRIFKYKKKNDQIKNRSNYDLGYLYKVENVLNDKVKLYQETNTEIIEENKEIEELNDTNYLDNMIAGEKEYYHNITRTRLNEVIRAVNKLIKEREEK